MKMNEQQQRRVLQLTKQLQQTTTTTATTTTTPTLKPVWKGRFVLIGAGLNGQCFIPLMFRYIDISPRQVTVISADNSGQEVANKAKVAYVVAPVTKENYHELLHKYLAEGDFLLNLSVCVSSVDVVAWCQLHKVVYVDASLEVWGNEFLDTNLSAEARSNYRTRQTILDMREKLKSYTGSTTAVLCHGANPGLVESFTKQALLDICEAIGSPVEIVPATREDWAALARKLDVKVIQVSERDSQQSSIPKKPNELVQTWSAFAYLEEITQGAELGWGTHEKHLPEGAITFNFGNKSSILMNKPSAAVHVRTWCPSPGSHFGTLTTHHECLEMADYFTVKSKTGDAIYRPTVMYAYHPCDDAVLSERELLEREFVPQEKLRILLPPHIAPGGFDEVGVLILGHAKTAYWYGVHNTIEQVATLTPGTSINATTIPVIFGVLAGVMWAMTNPARGITEPVDINHVEILDFVKPILGCFGTFCDWTPIKNRTSLISTQLDVEDPWQFDNFAC